MILKWRRNSTKIILKFRRNSMSSLLPRKQNTNLLAYNLRVSPYIYFYLSCFPKPLPYKHTFSPNRCVHMCMHTHPYTRAHTHTQTYILFFVLLNLDHLSLYFLLLLPICTELTLEGFFHSSIKFFFVL